MIGGSASFQAWGGDGDGPTTAYYGHSQEVQGTIPLTPGETLTAYVGDASGNGYHPGGVGSAGSNQNGFHGGGSSALVSSIRGLMFEAGGGGGSGGYGLGTSGAGHGGNAYYPFGSGAYGANGTHGTASGSHTGGGGGGGGGNSGNGGGGLTAAGQGGTLVGEGGASGQVLTNTYFGGGGGAAGSSYFSSYCTNIGYYNGIGGQLWGTVIVDYTTADAPLAPTPLSPAAGTTVYVSSATLPITWSYVPASDSGTQAAYLLQIVDTTTSTTYWYNAAAGNFSLSAVVNPGSAGSVNMSTVPLVPGHSYTWAVATQESYYNLQGPYCSPQNFTFSGVWATSANMAASFEIPAMAPTIQIQSSTTVHATAELAFTYGAPNWSPGQLNSIGTPLPVFAQSLIFYSFHNVAALQFATVQSNAVQLIPNDRFQNQGHYLTYQWNQSTDFQPSGSANLSFDSVTNSVIVTHGNQSSVVVGHSLIRPPVAPVLAETAQGAGSLIQSGVLSPPVVPSAQGRLYAGLRFTPLTPLNNPIELQLLVGGATPSSQTVLNTWTLSGRFNQPQMAVFPFDVGEFAPSGTQLQLQVVQANSGSQNDIWSVQALSLFDEGIFWQFSVDGGVTWMPGQGARNNPYGVVSFPVPNSELMWKATFYQPNLVLNELEIRPLYQGNSAFLDLPVGIKGATVEFNDIWASIQTDPLFNQTLTPVPRNWYS